MELLAQIADDVNPPPHVPGLESLWPLIVFNGAVSLLSLIYSAFWIWMFIQCLRSEPDRYFWIWIFLVVPFGAVVYAVLRYFPANNYQAPSFLKKWTRGRELDRLETAAEQIGNPHQFVLWGDALRDVGRWSAADHAYTQALKKEPDNLQALWGAALVAEHDKRPADVERHTRKILDKDPQYKFGDVSLAYGKSLADQGRAAEAREHLEQHIKRWRHPEAMYRLACLARDEGDAAAARQHLRSMLQDLNASPIAIARKHSRWKSRAKQMFRKLPKEA